MMDREGRYTTGVGPIEGPGEGGEPFTSEDPTVLQRARSSITVAGPDKPGGLCYGCAHYDDAFGCSGYNTDLRAGPQLRVQPDRIADSQAYAPRRRPAA